MSTVELATEMTRTKRISPLAFHRWKVRKVAAEFLRMAAPVQIRKPIGFRSFACACGFFPHDKHSFCAFCGKHIQWIEGGK